MRTLLGAVIALAGVMVALTVAMAKEVPPPDENELSFVVTIE